MQPGETMRLDLGVVAEGTYGMLCTIAGHAAAGMTGMLHVGGASSATGAASEAPTTTMDFAAMDAEMEAVAKAFPAKTAGHGGDPLAPEVLPDGTKEFDLTAEIVDWEVEPGQAW